MASRPSLQNIPILAAFRGNRAAFGAGHFAKSLVWSLTDLLFCYHANAVMGLSATTTGLLLTCTMLYSGALDLLVAWALREAEGRPASTLKAQLVGGVATAVFLMLLFYPLAATPDVTCAYLVIVSLLFRTAYAVYDVTQNALTSLLPRDPDDARAYVTIRLVLGAVARLCIAASAALLVGDLAGASRYSAFVTVPVAVLVLVSSVRLAHASPPKRSVLTSPVRPAIASGMIRPLLGAIAHAAGLTLLSRFLVFVDGGVAGQSTGTILLLSFVVGTAIGPFATAGIGARIGSMRTGIVLTGMALAGALPLTMTPHAALVALAALLYGIGLGGSSALIWAAASDAILGHAERSGARTDLLSFAALTATIKLSVAATGLVFGTLLDGFKAGDSGAAGAIIAFTLFGGMGFLLAMRPADPTDYLKNREINRARASAVG